MWSWIVIIQTGSQGRAGYMIAGGYSFHFTDPACCKTKQKNVKWKKKRIIIIDLTWQKNNEANTKELGEKYINTYIKTKMMTIVLVD